MSKLVRLDPRYWPEGGYGHWCPGCDCGHEISVDAPNPSGARWTFNGNRYRPTFAPSVNIRTGKYADPTFDDATVPSSICHYFVRDGMIQFLDDCTHALAGKTVEMPEMPQDKYMTSERL
jgi:hypothetical protein